MSKTDFTVKAKYPGYSCNMRFRNKRKLYSFLYQLRQRHREWHAQHSTDHKNDGLKVSIIDNNQKPAPKAPRDNADN